MPAATGKKSIRELVATADDIPREIVPVPEWNGVKIEMRGMSTGSRGRFLQDMVQDDGEVRPDFTRYFADVVIACAYDPEDGSKAFEPNDQDRALLNDKAALITERLGTVALRLSGLDQGSLEEGKGGSSAIPRAASTSDSPATSG